MTAVDEIRGIVATARVLGLVMIHRHLGTDLRLGNAAVTTRKPVNGADCEANIFPHLRGYPVTRRRSRLGG